ncbi:MAG: UTP--glucose-1-phosphate uridylyltransferase [Labilithrix sp.]|nr:UTP--glucose-1-phosphate uridylyltransferase [Labilithrix sp.]MBX3219835.1 UTP--glucose-1-phosphate uridylyltransferase [Labilithrix sp.]
MPTPHPDLQKQLAALDPALASRLAAAGFDRARFLALAATLTDGDAALRRRLRNTVKGEVTPPRAGEIAELPAAGSPEHERLRARGAAALAGGELAFCTMAGGMATRMGGIVKALAEVDAGRSFLDLRLGENRSASARAGRPIPLWLMTSEATHEPLTKALAEAGAPAHVACFMQDLSLRLNPDGTLFLDDSGAPSVHATGHGDLVDALRRAHLLDAFVASGGKYVWITNVDNLGASIDEAILGRFIEATERGVDVQCEVCPKAGDKGGIPVHAEGKLQVLEEFRLPPELDPTTVDVFNTNTFLVRAEPMAKAPLGWTYFEVEKQVDGRPAIQFERLIQEITAHLPSTYLRVPREGVESRFLPVKDYEELARRRADIGAVARARGML